MTISVRSRRLLFASSAIVLTLASCGDPNGTRKATGTTIAQPVATSPAAPAGGSTTAAAHRPRTIVVGANGKVLSAGAGAVPAGVGAADAGVGSKMVVRPTTYVYAGDVPSLPATAGAWSFPAGGHADQAAVAKLAVALGVDGTPTELPVDQGGGWRVGPSDGTGPELVVSSDGPLSWWYSDPAAGGSMRCATTATGSSSGSTGAVAPPAPDVVPVTTPAAPTTDVPATDVPATDVPVPVDPGPVCEPPTPVDLPTADQAKAAAADLLTKAGLDVSSFAVTAQADQWSATVTATLRLGGLDTQMTASIGFGAHAAITWASGFLATPVRADDYPLIDVPAAVARLNDQSFGWLRGGVMPMNEGGVVIAVGSSGGGVIPAGGRAIGAPGAPPAIAPAPASPPVPASAVADAPATTNDGTPLGTVKVHVPVDLPPITACDPACPVPEAPPPVTVTLRNAQPSLEQVWSPDGTVWLLPGYRFDADDGGQYSIVAVTDDLLQQYQVDPGTPTTDAVPPATDVAPATTVAPPPPTAIGEPTTTVPPATVPPTTVTGSTLAADTAACSTDVTITPPFDTTNLTVEGLKFLVGLCRATATDVATGLGITVRPISIDGQPQAITDNVDEHRVNVVIVNDTVTQVVSIG